MASSKKPPAIHIFGGTPKRKTGETFRAIVRAMALASARPRVNVLFTCGVDAQAERAYNKAMGMLMAFGVDVEYDNERRKMTLPNGSTILFSYPDRNKYTTLGTRFDAYICDGVKDYLTAPRRA